MSRRTRLRIICQSSTGTHFSRCGLAVFSLHSSAVPFQYVLFGNAADFSRYDPAAFSRYNLAVFFLDMSFFAKLLILTGMV